MATIKNGNVSVYFADATPNQTVLYNSLGRGATEQAQQGGWNPFGWIGDKINSGVNAFGTTIGALGESGGNLLGAAWAGLTGGDYTSARSKVEEQKNQNNLKDNKNRMNAIAQKYGYNTYQDVWDAMDRAEAEGDTDTLNYIQNTINPELNNQANENAGVTQNTADAYNDSRQNGWFEQRINQDRGKFAGSALNTLSTMADVAGMATGAPFLMLKNRVLGNALQGAIGGVANELERNGFENFDANNAAQGALIGGLSGWATGKLNNKLGATVDPSEITTKGLHGLWDRTLNSQIGRGAVSGALGGAIGGGLSAGMNGGDVLSGAWQGGTQGALSGATTSAMMQGAGKLGGAVLNKISPELAAKVADNQQIYNRWLASGDTTMERLNNTARSGQSGVANWVMKGGPAKVANRLRNIGQTIQNTAPQFDRQNGSVENNLAAIRNSIENENVSYDELAYLQDHQKDIMDLGDIELAQWAGITEDEFNGAPTQMASNVNTRLNELRNAIKNENISYGELAELQSLAPEIFKTGDTELAQWAGIDEADWDAYQNGDTSVVNKYGGNQQTPNQNKYVSVNSMTRERTEYTPEQVAKLIADFEAYEPTGTPNSSAQELDWSLGDSGSKLLEIYSTMYGKDPLAVGYNKAEGEQFMNWVNQQKQATAGTQAPQYLTGNDPDSRYATDGWGNPSEDANAMSRTGRLAIPDNEADIQNMIGVYEKALQKDMALYEAETDPNMKQALSAQVYQDKSRLSDLNDALNDLSQSQATSIADFKKQGLGVRNAEQAAYKKLISDYGENTGADDPLQAMIDNADAAGLPGDSNFRKAQRLVEGGDFGISYDDAFNDLKAIYGDDFNEKIYLNKDGSWKYKNGEPYVWTTYKNKIAMALSKEMDARQNAAQEPTAKDWAKQVVKRTGESLNDKGLGLSVKDVSKEDNNPETELYRKLMGSGDNATPTEDGGEDAKDLTGVFDSNKYGKIQKRNFLQGMGDQLLQDAESQKFLGLQGQLSGATAKDAMDRGIPQQLADLDVLPQNYGDFGKTSDYINGVVDDLAHQSNVRVSLPDLASDLDYNNLGDVVIDSEAARKKYEYNVRALTAKGDNPGEYTAGQLIDFSRRMGKLANSTSDPQLAKAYNNAKYVTRNAATAAMDEAGLFGDATDNLIAKGLKDMGASQKVQDYYTAAVDGRSPNASDYIRRTAPAEVAKKMASDMKAEPLVRSASKEPTKVGKMLWRNSGFEQPVNTLLRYTVAPVASTATKLAGKTLRLAGDIQAAPSVLPDQTVLWNALGRENANYATKQNQDANERATAYLNEASAGSEPMALLASTSPAYANTTSADTGTSETALYDAFNTPTTESATSYGATPSYNTTATSGNSWADTIYGAMERAAEAGDAEAFGTLYQMYASANKANTEKDMSDPTNWSSADRTKLINAQNGLSQIDTLADAYLNATGGQGGNGLEGNLRNFGNTISFGNLDPAASNYNNLAQSVGMGIIKNLVNLGVTESDAERYKQYLPALTDTREQAEIKLETLRKIYQDQINNLRSVYGA